MQLVSHCDACRRPIPPRKRKARGRHELCAACERCLNADDRYLREVELVVIRSIGGDDGKSSKR